MLGLVGQADDKGWWRIDGCIDLRYAVNSDGLLLR